MQGANLFNVPRVPAEGQGGASKCIYAKANGTYSEIKSPWPWQRRLMTEWKAWKNCWATECISMAVDGKTVAAKQK